MTRPIGSLDKGLQVLQMVAARNGPVALADLARNLPWDKSTVYRLLETLRQRDFVAHTEAGYAPGRALRRLGVPPQGQDTLESARKAMVRLAEESGETAHLAIPIGDAEIAFIDRRSTGRFTLHTEIGSREPLHCTALGKAWLARMGEAELMNVLRDLPLRPFTKRTLRTQAGLRKEIRAVRRQGYAVDNCEYDPGVRCAAAAVETGVSGEIVLLGVSGPALRIDEKRMHALGALCAKLATGKEG